MDRHTATVRAIALVGALALLVGCAAPPAPVTGDRAGGGAVANARPPAAPESSGPAAVTMQRGQGDQPLPSDQAILHNRRIIYTADLTLEARDPAEAMQRIERLIRDSGGFVASSNTTFDDGRPVVVMSVRAPVESYDAVLAGIRGVATKVRSESQTSQDVSDEYADVGAQIRNLEATEAQLLVFMQRANTIDEVLRVQAQLTQVRGQIERLRARQLTLERRTELATITLRILTVAAPAQSPIPNPLDAVQPAWEMSLRFLAGVATVAVGSAVFLWWAIPLIALGVWAIARALRRRTVRPSAAPAQPSA